MCIMCVHLFTCVAMRCSVLHVRAIAHRVPCEKSKYNYRFTTNISILRVPLTPQCAVVCRSVLQCAVVCYSVLCVLRCVAVRCSVLQCVAIRCSVLQRVGSVLLWGSSHVPCKKVCIHTFLCVRPVAVCCGVVWCTDLFLQGTKK